MGFLVEGPAVAGPVREGLLPLQGPSPSQSPYTRQTTWPQRSPKVSYARPSEPVADGVRTDRICDDTGDQQEVSGSRRKSWLWKGLLSEEYTGSAETVIGAEEKVDETLRSAPTPNNSPPANRLLKERPIGNGSEAISHLETRKTARESGLPSLRRESIEKPPPSLAASFYTKVGLASGQRVTGNQSGKNWAVGGSAETIQSRQSSGKATASDWVDTRNQADSNHQESSSKNLNGATSTTRVSFSGSAAKQESLGENSVPFKPTTVRQPSNWQVAHPNLERLARSISGRQRSDLEHVGVSTGQCDSDLDSAVKVATQGRASTSRTSVNGVERNQEWQGVRVGGEAGGRTPEPDNWVTEELRRLTRIAEGIRNKVMDGIRSPPTSPHASTRTTSSPPQPSATFLIPDSAQPQQVQSQGGQVRSQQGQSHQAQSQQEQEEPAKSVSLMEYAGLVQDVVVKLGGPESLGLKTDQGSSTGRDPSSPVLGVPWFAKGVVEGGKTSTGYPSPRQSYEKREPISTSQNSEDARSSVSSDIVSKDRGIQIKVSESSESITPEEKAQQRAQFAERAKSFRKNSMQGGASSSSLKDDSGSFPRRADSEAGSSSSAVLQAKPSRESLSEQIVVSLEDSLAHPPLFGGDLTISGRGDSTTRSEQRHRRSRVYVETESVMEVSPEKEGEVTPGHLGEVPPGGVPGVNPDVFLSAAGQLRVAAQEIRANLGCRRYHAVEQLTHKVLGLVEDVALEALRLSNGPPLRSLSGVTMGRSTSLGHRRRGAVGSTAELDLDQFAEELSAEVGDFMTPALSRRTVDLTVMVPGKEVKREDELSPTVLVVKEELDTTLQSRPVSESHGDREGYESALQMLVASRGGARRRQWDASEETAVAV